MVAPIDYTQALGDPMGMALVGYKMGAGIAEHQAKLQQAALQQQQQQQAMQAFEHAQAKFQALRNPSALDVANYAQAMAAVNPQMATSMQPYLKEIPAAQQRAFLGQGMQVLAAITTSPEVAKQYMTKLAAASRQSGDEDDAAQWEQFAQQVDTAPAAVAEQLAARLSLLDGFKDAAESLGKLGAEQRARELQPAMVTRGRAEAETAQSEAKIKAAEAQYAAQLRRAELAAKEAQAYASHASGQASLASAANTMASAIKTQAEAQNPVLALDKDSRKMVNDMAMESVSARQSAQKNLALAEKVAKLGTSWGALNTMGEWFRDVTGNQNERSLIQSELTRVINSDAMTAWKAVTSGTTSDRDVITAMKGAPPPTAAPAVLASYLRGSAKVHMIAAEMKAGGAEWIANNNGVLTRATREFVAGGVVVKPGMTYADYLKRVAKNVNTELSMQATAQALPPASAVRNLPTVAAPAARPAPPQFGAQQQGVINKADMILNMGGGR